MKYKPFALLLALAMLLSLAACGTAEDPNTQETAPQEGDAGSAAETDTPEAETEETDQEEAAGIAVTGTQTVVVEGFDWGPAVTKTVITLDQPVAPESLTPESFTVVETKESFNWAAMGDDSQDPTVHVTAEAPRSVTGVYPCDEEGNQVDTASASIALELAYDPNSGSPYCYDVITGQNTVCNPYELAITLAEGSSLTTQDGTAVSQLTVEPSVDLADAWVPQLEGVDLSGTFTGSDGKTLTYGSYAPADDGGQHPLVIWLHGAGEGGTDPSIPLLGNKVTALYGEEFQSVLGGAYVLTPQTPTFWLTYTEEGAWQDNPGTDSVYLPTLKELIDHYVAEHPDIDPNRIYVGGCSNGGYMTVNLILAYPDYFAAAFPICEAYLDSGITEEQLTAIQDLPVWFVYAANDTVVPPDQYAAPTVARLQEMGADVHVSVFEDVHDTTGLYTNEDGTPYQYMGHWSWLYFFNNQCEEDGVSLWQWLAEQSR